MEAIMIEDPPLKEEPYVPISIVCCSIRIVPNIHNTLKRAIGIKKRSIHEIQIARRTFGISQHTGPSQHFLHFAIHLQ